MPDSAARELLAGDPRNSNSRDRMLLLPWRGVGTKDDDWNDEECELDERSYQEEFAGILKSPYGKDHRGVQNVTDDCACHSGAKWEAGTY